MSRSLSSAKGILAAGLFVSAAAIAGAQTPPAAPQAPAEASPVFRSGTELFIVQVQLVSNDGEALTGLRSDQFTVAIDNTVRRIRFAEAVGFDSGRGEPVRPMPGAAFQWSVDSFFTPVPKRASVQYVLGVEGSQPPHAPLVRVRVARRGVNAWRWMWRTVPPTEVVAP